MKKILLWSALLLTLPAHAEWMLINNNDLGEEFIDPATIKKTGSIRRAWQRLELAKPYKGSALSTRSLYEVDCGEQKRRVIQLTAFSGRGFTGEMLVTATTSNGLDTSWEFVEPGTAGQVMLQFVCSQ